MQDITGFLIRYHRLKQNYSQEGLCKGICVVSYLSKIEQGQVQASSDIIHALYNVLNIPFYNDENLMNQGKTLMRTIVEKIFLEEEYEEELQKIKSHENIYTYSPLCVMYACTLLCVSFYKEKNVKDDLKKLDVFIPCMNDDQLFVYHYIFAHQEISQEERMLHLREAKKYGDYSILYHAIGGAYITIGDFSNALFQQQKAYEVACKEGNGIMMLSASMQIGNCYASIREEELMLKQYEQTQTLCRTMKNKNMEAFVLYNAGSTLLELGRYDDGEKALLKSLTISQREKEDIFLTYHKLFFLYLKQQNVAKCKECMEKMNALFKEIKFPAYKHLMNFVEHYFIDTELRKDICVYLLIQICECDTIFYGLRRFHAPFLIRAYCNQRRYKEALEISKQWNVNDVFI